MHRLQDAGDRIGARTAFTKATSWICRYASMATSGGERVAHSRERDALLAGLASQFHGAAEP